MDADQQWVGPTLEEQGLFAAVRNNDSDAYWSVLAGAYVFVPMRLDQARKILAEQLDDEPDLVTAGHGGGHELDVHTRGLVPPQLPPGTVLEQRMFAPFVSWLADHEPKWTLVVDRGTPVESRATMRDVGRWLTAHPQAVVKWSDLRTRHDIRTMWNGPLYGELAVALACGAHLSVMNAVPWNTMGAPYLNFLSDGQTLRDWWGVETVEEWRATIDTLFDRDGFGPVDLVLALRNQVAQQLGAPVVGLGRAALADAVAGFCRDRGLPAEEYEGLVETAEWVTRCEAWMRRDAVLPPDGYVATQVAWDLGRAVNMARWGVSVGFCDIPTAEQIVTSVGRQSAAAYASWYELSAGYILGRTIKMGLQGDPEKTYQESLSIHRALVGDPASPWRNLSLR